MSRSGRKYRDPFQQDAQRRKAGPHAKQTRRQRIEDLEREEREEEIVRAGMEWGKMIQGEQDE